MEEDSEEDTEATEDIFDTLIDLYFEGLDFEYFYDDFYDGIDETPIAQEMGISSLAFERWFEPCSNDPSQPPHPDTTGKPPSTNN